MEKKAYIKPQANAIDLQAQHLMVESQFTFKTYNNAGEVDAEDAL